MADQVEMPIGDPADDLDEPVPSSFLRERALAAVAANLAPAPFVVLPFCLLVSTLMRDEVSSVHLGWWLIAGVVTTGITLFALYRYYMRSERNATTVVGQLLIGLSFVSIGATLGMGPWVAEGKIGRAHV